MHLFINSCFPHSYLRASTGFALVALMICQETVKAEINTMEKTGITNIRGVMLTLLAKFSSQLFISR